MSLILCFSVLIQQKYLNKYFDIFQKAFHKFSPHFLHTVLIFLKLFLIQFYFMFDLVFWMFFILFHFLCFFQFYFYIGNPCPPNSLKFFLRFSRELFKNFHSTFCLLLIDFFPISSTVSITVREEISRFCENPVYWSSSIPKTREIFLHANVPSQSRLVRNHLKS